MPLLRPAMHVVAFDGKALKGSFDNFNDVKAKQVLSAFAVNTALVLAHIEIDEKSNEIPAGAETVGRTQRGRPYRHLRCDALSKKTFEAAAAANAHLIVQLKDNELTLRQNVEAVCNTTTPLSGVRTVYEKRRNRHETRTVAVFDATPAVVGTQWEPYVAAVVQVERTVHAFQPATSLWRTSAETSFYLCNCMIDANRAAIAVRMHWGIENKFHYTRDVTLREDASRIRKNPGVFARIRCFAYNILRFNQSDIIPQDRYAAALGGLKSIFSMTFSK